MLHAHHQLSVGAYYCLPAHRGLLVERPSQAGRQRGMRERPRRRGPELLLWVCGCAAIGGWVAVQKRFIVMGLLDCGGTFLSALGSAYTPGVLQTLLNQVGR